MKQLFCCHRQTNACVLWIVRDAELSAEYVTKNPVNIAQVRTFHSNDANTAANLRSITMFKVHQQTYIHNIVLALHSVCLAAYCECYVGTARITVNCVLQDATMLCVQ
jgi:hypothetical protein